MIKVMSGHNYGLKISVLIGSLLLFTNCVKQGNITPGENDPILSEIGTFDFATTDYFQLTVDYSISDYTIMFEVYEQNPLEVIDDAFVKNENLKPLFRAITDDKGYFNGPISMPTHIKEVFLYTDYIGLPTVIPVQVIDKNINFSIKTSGKALSKSVSTKAGINGDFLTIGGWNNTGLPDYLLTRAKLTGELMNNIKYSLPESRHGVGQNGDPNRFIIENQAIGDLKIVKPTKVNLVFMHEGASMTSALGYYCYPTANPPTSKEEIKRIIAIPNCSYAFSSGELSSGDRVQLKYWDGTKLVEEFPAGTTIGWFLIASGFRNTNGIVTDNPLTTYYSNPAFNAEEAEKKQHCVALRDANRKIIALGFEDQNRERKNANGVLIGDSDFNDAVFYVETTESEAIDDSEIPNIAPDPKPGPVESDNIVEYSGSLAYEDLWPSRGDYDMNDVVIDYKSTHYRNWANQVIKVVDEFTPRHVGGSIHNGFGYQLGVSTSKVSKLLVESDCWSDFNLFKTDATGLELGQSKATIMLFESAVNVLYNKEKSKTFKVIIEFASAVKIEELTVPPYNSFLVCNTINKDNTLGNRGKEVHLPNRLPTDLADKSLLGTGNDKSQPDKGIYYISEDNYMFALNLPVSFAFPDEKQKLDDAYPDFSSWASSKGKEKADWYLNKKK